MSLKTVLFSALLATGVFATSHGNSYGGGGQEKSPWAGGNAVGAAWDGAAAGAGGAVSCPAGCQPIQTGAPQGGNGELIVQVVSVADNNGSLKYFPNKVDAPVGSIVQFQFHPKNHTVTESSFAEPCKAIASNLTSATRPGLRSGFVPVMANATSTPVYNVLINDTKPIWIFCGQTRHCQQGMAMVINQNNSSPNTIEKYIENAAAVPVAGAASTASSSAVLATPEVATATVATAANTATFGAVTASSSVAEETTAVAATAPPAETVATSAAPAAPAVFTGAAVRRTEASSGLLVLGALLAAW